jgi:zinc/manganese transport system permease protein
VARASGVPTAALDLGFLVLLGLAVAATAQITGALLVFALLVTPAATAQQVTARPGPGLALSVLIALGVTWTGLGIAYFSPYPVGFWVTTLSFATYVLVRLIVAGLRARSLEPVRSPG